MVLKRNQGGRLVRFLAAAALLVLPRAAWAAPQPAPDRPVKQAAMTAMAAAVCAGSYHPENSEEVRYLEDYGWKLTPYTLKDGKTEVNFTLARKPDPLRGKIWNVLAFRGSASKGDWKLNLQMETVDYPSGKTAAGETDSPAVHKGFLQYARTALSQPLDVDGDGKTENLGDYLKTHPRERLLLTGHSLGGAGATLVGEELAAQGVSRAQIPVITFGAPAVGNQAFAREYGTKISLLRAVTSLDPVPGALQTVTRSGYQQFGEKKEYALSGKYTDYQHPISYYLDLAVRDYYQERQKAVEAGIWPPAPREQREGTGPLTALVILSRDNGADTRYSPDLGQFLLDEYRSLLPRYVVLEYRHTAGSEDLWSQEEIRQKARQVGADILVVAQVERHRVGQSDKWSIQLGQEVLGLGTGGVHRVTAGSTRVRFEQGVLQSLLTLWEEQKKEVQNVLPEANRQEPLWIFLREEGNLNENH